MNYDLVYCIWCDELCNEGSYIFDTFHDFNLAYSRFCELCRNRKSCDFYLTILLADNSC